MNELAIYNVIAESTIRKKIYRYCHSVDRLDAEMGYSVFAEDCVVDYGKFHKGDPKELIDKILAYHVKDCSYTSHQVTNVLIEVDGDRAASEAYCTAAIEKGTSDTRTLKIARVRYNDLWELRGEDWLCVRRVVSGDISYMNDGTVLTDRYNSSRGDSNDGSCGIIS